MILITELDKAPGFLENAKDIIEEYGHYLFCQLNLKAGTDTFYEELNSFPFPNYVLPHGSFFLAVNENQVIG
ncbi:MAG TPA: hypothetical protein VGO09_03410, partial [Flavisolibacter sp.]|nr:hypothetical protein [Flavisolibacter sp.]